MRKRQITLGSLHRIQENPLLRADAASAKALVFAEVGQLHNALSTAERIRDPDLRESTFQSIARARKLKTRTPRMAFEDLRTRL
jgi:hypothetical protein